MAERAVVSWAGPVQRAREALDRASELLERKQNAKGMADLQESRHQIDVAMDFLLKQEQPR